VATKSPQIQSSLAASIPSRIDALNEAGRLLRNLELALLTPSRETGKGANLANDAPPSSASGRVTDSPEPKHQEHQAHAASGEALAESQVESQAESQGTGSLERSADPAGQQSRADQPSSRRVVLDETRIRRALRRIAHEIVESNADPSSLYLVAVPNGGVPLGRILVQNLEEICGCEAPLGILDTTLYRDDLASRGTRPRLRRTEMPSSVDERVVVLVEDHPTEPGLLGRYDGVPLTERGEWYGTGDLVLPDRITIYRWPLCAMCRTEEEIVEQVAVTVIHEVAHHFGIDDDRLDELGWS
jgi:predicted Zn-dependent protease with MMP-like domain